MQWYVNQKGKTSGPFDEERLAMLVHWGKISRDAFICDKQQSAWIGIQRSAFAALLPDNDPAGAGPVAGSEASARGGAAPAGAGWRSTIQAGSKQVLGLMALSVILAGVLIAAL